MPDPVDMDTPDLATPPESVPSGDPQAPEELAPPVPESTPSGDPVL